jgi:hypothetical protein
MSTRECDTHAKQACREMSLLRIACKFGLPGGRAATMCALRFVSGLYRVLGYVKGPDKPICPDL